MKNTSKTFIAIVSFIFAGYLSCHANGEPTLSDNYHDVTNRFKSSLEMASSQTNTINELPALRSLVFKLIELDVETTEERIRIADLLSDFLGRVRTEIIPNFDPLPVVSNVKPPISGGSPVFSGMDPLDIADPEARAQYQEAIRINQQNNLINKRQRELVSTDRITSKVVVKYIADTFSDSDSKLPQFVECIEKAKLTENEIDEINSHKNSNK